MDDPDRRSDPSFKQGKDKVLFMENFKYRNTSKEEITAIFRRIDEFADASNEKTGKHIESERLHGMVIAAMNEDDDRVLERIDPGKLDEEMEGLLLRHPPVFFDDDTSVVLNRLKMGTGQSSFSLLEQYWPL